MPTYLWSDPNQPPIALPVRQPVVQEQPSFVEDYVPPAVPPVFSFDRLMDGELPSPFGTSNAVSYGSTVAVPASPLVNSVATTPLYKTGAGFIQSIPDIINPTDEQIYASSYKNRLSNLGKRTFRQFYSPDHYVFFNRPPSMAPQNLVDYIDRWGGMGEITYDTSGNVSSMHRAQGQAPSQRDQAIAETVKKGMEHAKQNAVPNKRLLEQRNESERVARVKGGLSRGLTGALGFTNLLGLLSQAINPDPYSPIGQFVIMQSPEQYPEQYEQLRQAYIEANTI